MRESHNGNTGMEHSTMQSNFLWFVPRLQNHIALIKRGISF